MKDPDEKENSAGNNQVELQGHLSLQSAFYVPAKNRRPPSTRYRGRLEFRLLARSESGTSTFALFAFTRLVSSFGGSAFFVAGRVAVCWAQRQLIFGNTFVIILSDQEELL
jgi:hypothetical protein